MLRPIRSKPNVPDIRDFERSASQVAPVLRSNQMTRGDEKASDRTVSLRTLFLVTFLVAFLLWSRQNSSNPWFSTTSEMRLKQKAIDARKSLEAHP
jgi:hypothetical protein